MTLPSMPNPCPALGRLKALSAHRLRSDLQSTTKSLETAEKYSCCLSWIVRTGFCFFFISSSLRVACWLKFHVVAMWKSRFRTFNVLRHFFSKFKTFFNFNKLQPNAWLDRSYVERKFALCPSDLLLIPVLLLRSLASITQQLGFQLDEAAMFAEQMSMKKNKQ